MKCVDMFENELNVEWNAQNMLKNGARLEALLIPGLFSWKFAETGRRGSATFATPNTLYLPGGALEINWAD